MRPPAYNFTFHHISNWQWVQNHLGYFWSLSRTHLYMALASVVLGLVVALPMGVLAARVPRSYPPILAVTTVLYALPSLAVLAFLVGITGLTDNTVILPLAAYALAILVRSIADGLKNVPDEVRTAATAMGYRPVRRLVAVELPAAVPVIIAGLRVATVSSISLVTVGSLIGIGGLGQLFIAGENADFLTEILAGVVIVALWALLFDALLLLAGRLLAPWARRTA
ncbi:MAG TPA: ABC transporter permease subunit [Acidimicrobiales bacterium]|nr:ABC transporter permease subunit [Acidimicrobiales bacterium]